VAIKETLISVLGQYAPIDGRYGIDSIDVPYIISSLLMLLVVWGILRIIVNFLNSINNR
jgi:hypothetical protein